jgi:hypothetical protein
MQHEPDYAHIMANFHIKHADTTQIKACLPTLVAELQKFGCISDACLHKQPFARDLVRSPSTNPTANRRAWQGDMISEADQVQTKKRRRVRDTVDTALQAAAQEATARKVAAKALRVERKRLALEKQQNRMLRETGRLTNSKRKRNEAEL